MFSRYWLYEASNEVIKALLYRGDAHLYLDHYGWALYDGEWITAKEECLRVSIMFPNETIRLHEDRYDGDELVHYFKNGKSYTVFGYTTWPEFDEEFLK